MKIKNILSNLREKIINIDESILKLLFLRRKLVINIIKEKIKNNISIKDTNREKILINHLISYGKNKKLDSTYIKNIFKFIIKDSILIQENFLQKKLNSYNKYLVPKISFLGPQGSFSHLAANFYVIKNFKNYEEVSCKKFFDVIYKVENKKADFAILPIENTSSGLIIEVYELLQKTKLSIVSEILFPINHCILAKKGINIKNITTVYSHPQPFLQCSKFFKNYPHWKIKYTQSTAAAMKKIITLKNKVSAAIGSKFGTELYNLQILKKNLADEKKNITRFIILSKNAIKVSEQIQAKTSIIISTKQSSDIFLKIFQIFHKYNLIIVKLIEYPKNDYSKYKYFYIDIKKNLFSQDMQKAIIKLKDIVKTLKILGCYPIYK